MDFLINKLDEKKSGIYIIKSKVSDDSYIGSTKCFRERYIKHLSNLKMNKRYGKLSDFVDKNGLNTLQMNILIIESNELDLRELEYSMIQKLNPSLNCKRQKSNIKNIWFTGNGWDGKKHKKESIEKIRKSMPKKPVRILTKEGKLFDECESINEVSRKYNFAESHVSSCCHGRKLQAYGYKFEFIIKKP